MNCIRLARPFRFGRFGECEVAKPRGIAVNAAAEAQKGLFQAHLSDENRVAALLNDYCRRVSKALGSGSAKSKPNSRIARNKARAGSNRQSGVSADWRAFRYARQWSRLQGDSAKQALRRQWYGLCRTTRLAARHGR